MDPILQETIHALEERNWWFVGMRAIARALVGTRRFRRALDVGCGSGGNLGLLASIADEVSAIDRAPRVLAWARDRTGSLPARLAAADATALPFRAGAFDLVFVWSLVEHVEDDAAVLEEAARVVEPGGVVLVSTSASMALWSDHDVANHHLRRYSARALRARIESAGLRVRRLTHANTALYGPVAVVSAAHRVRARLGRRPPYRKNAVDLPPVIDAILVRMLGLEARWLARHDLPLGVSLLAVAERP